MSFTFPSFVDPHVGGWAVRLAIGQFIQWSPREFLALSLRFRKRLLQLVWFS